MKSFRCCVLGLLLFTGGMRARGETCTTQSQMKPADRDALAAAAKGLAAKVQAGDAAGVKSGAVGELAKDFSAVEYVVGNSAPKLKGGALSVEQVYLLDATQLKRNADGSAEDSQFFCSLNKSPQEVNFLIPSLPPGLYGFAIVDVSDAAPWRLSFLLRKEQAGWLMAGFYPKATTAAGHDGLWYWTEARKMATAKQPWDAWLYYQQAKLLLRPVNFVQSSHLDKLDAEQKSAAPPQLTEGVSAEAPLVVKGADSVEYRFIGLGVDDSLAKDKVDVAAHLQVPSLLTDPGAARKRNDAAAAALLRAFPEMRPMFHGVWIYAEADGQAPFATEQTMSEIH